MRISIIGYSGSGKSTLAGKLGELYRIPVLYLDTVQFTAGWKERDRAEALTLVKAFMEQESWVIDGNYRSFAQEERLERSDRIIFLNIPRYICLLRALKRYVQNRGKTRASMAEGCEEKLDFEFVKWILIDQRSREIRRHMREITEKYPEKMLEVRNKKQLEYLLKRLAGEKKNRL